LSIGLMFLWPAIFSTHKMPSAEATCAKEGPVVMSPIAKYPGIFVL
jgi:hypothetical protein